MPALSVFSLTNWCNRLSSVRWALLSFFTADKCIITDSGYYDLITTNAPPIRLVNFFPCHCLCFLYSSQTGSHFDFSQQPGSPGWPQQLCLFITLIRLLRKTRYSFLWKGMGTDILEKKAFRLGTISRFPALDRQQGSYLLWVIRQIVYTIRTIRQVIFLWI